MLRIEEEEKETERLGAISLSMVTLSAWLDV